MEVLTYALSIIPRERVIYIHGDYADFRIFFGQGSHCHELVGAFDAHSQAVDDWLTANIQSSDYVFVDGTDSVFILAVYRKCARKQCKLCICTSFQAFHQSDENYMKYKGSDFTLPSWTKEEYLDAIECGALQMEKSDLDEMFFFAGGSIRLLLIDDISEIMRKIDRHVRRVENISSLLSGYIGDQSKAQINSLMYVTKTKVGTMSTTILSEYAAKQLSSICTPQAIGLARSVMSNNPAWQGWVSELECLHKIRESSGRVEFWDANGNSVIWPKDNHQVDSYEFADDLKLICCDNSFLVPIRWNEATADAIYFSSPNKLLRILQVSDSSSAHSYNFDVILGYASATGAHAVELVILTRLQKFSTVPLPTNRGNNKFTENLNKIRIANGGKRATRPDLFTIYKLCYDGSP